VLKGLVAGSKGRLSLAGLVAMGLAQIVRRLERSGAHTTYRERRIRLRAGRRRKRDTMRWAPRADEKMIGTSRQSAQSCWLKNQTSVEDLDLAIRRAIAVVGPNKSKNKVV
jgi:hypothetical protein